jgi:hypothetical protein
MIASPRTASPQPGHGSPLRVAGDARLAHNGAMPPRARPLLTLVSLWVLFGIICGTQIQVSMLAHHHSWLRVLGYQVLVWSLWIPASLGIAALVRRIPLAPPRPGPIALHLLVALAIGVVHAVPWVALVLWMRPYDFMNPTEFGTRTSGSPSARCRSSCCSTGWWRSRSIPAPHSPARASAAPGRSSRPRLPSAAARARGADPAALPVQHPERDRRARAHRQERRGGRHDRRAVGPLALLARPLGGARVPLDEETAMLARYLEIQRLRFRTA